MTGRAPHDDGEGPGDSLVDWAATGRRVRVTAAAVAVLAALGWVVAGLLGGGLALADLGDWVGLGLGIVVVSEVVVVGGAAVRAERRAAVRGERLGSGDVGLLPPRIGRPPVPPPDDAVDGTEPSPGADAPPHWAPVREDEREG